jgi:hypothetical protein
LHQEWQQLSQQDIRCLTGEMRWTLTHDKSSHGLWPGELKKSRKMLI